MMELKITDSTKEILDQYKADIEKAQSDLDKALKASNDILNIVMFEAHIDPNNVKDLKIDGLNLIFDYEIQETIQGNESGEDSNIPDS